jgi:hypothetical protein
MTAPLLGIGLIVFLAYCWISHCRRVADRKAGRQHGPEFVPAYLRYTMNGKGKY